MKKSFFSLLLLIVGVLACSPEKKESNTKDASAAVQPAEDIGIIIQPQTEPDTLKGSLKAYTPASVAGADIRVNYYSPAVRGRVIWGGLVPYDNVWVTGAHRATNIEFSKNTKMGESVLSAGKYALFTIPGKEMWTIIINKNWNQHLTDNYSAAEDVVRMTVTPTSNIESQERLRYEIIDRGAGKGDLVIQWEKIQVNVPFEVMN